MVVIQKEYFLNFFIVVYIILSVFDGLLVFEIFCIRFDDQKKVYGGVVIDVFFGMDIIEVVGIDGFVYYFFFFKLYFYEFIEI